MFVYIREAHPGSIVPGINDGQAVRQTDTLEERRELAAETVQELKLSFPVVVDKIDNKVNAAYAGSPDRLVIVGVDGKVAFYGERGPKGFKPSEVEAWLKNFVAVPGAVAANTEAVPAGKEFKGKVVRVNAEENTLTLTVDGKDQTFPIGKEAKFLALGRKRQLQDLRGGLGGVKNGNDVTVTTETKDGKALVTRVTVEGRRKNKNKQ